MLQKDGAVTQIFGNHLFIQVRKLAGGRNLICSVCGTRMAISRELADQVMVAPSR